MGIILGIGDDPDGHLLLGDDGLQEGFAAAGPELNGVMR